MINTGGNLCKTNTEKMMTCMMLCIAMLLCAVLHNHCYSTKNCKSLQSNTRKDINAWFLIASYELEILGSVGPLELKPS